MLGILISGHIDIPFSLDQAADWTDQTSPELGLGQPFIIACQKSPPTMTIIVILMLCILKSPDAMLYKMIPFVLISDAITYFIINHDYSISIHGSTRYISGKYLHGTKLLYNVYTLQSINTSGTWWVFWIYMKNTWESILFQWSQSDIMVWSLYIDSKISYKLSLFSRV